MNRLTRNLLIIAIFVLAFTVRFVDLGTHFAHYDDVLMTADILRAQTPNFREELLDAFYNPSRAHYNDPQRVLIRKIYDNPHTRFIFDTGVALAKFLIVPLDSPNAPLQLLLLSCLVRAEHNYREALFWARLPSFIFSSLTLLPLYLILKKRTSTGGLLFGLLLYALSLNSIINAKIGHTYAIGCLASAGLLLLIQYGQQKDFWQKHWKLSGILTSLFVYSHYQIFFFLPAYYLTNFAHKYKDREECKRLIFSGALNFLICLPVLIFLLFFNNAGTGGTAVYTLGLRHEFLYNPAGYGFPGVLLYTIFFYLRNSFIVLTHTLSPVTADKTVFWLCGIFFSLTFLHGLVKSRRQPETMYSIFSFATYLLLVGLQKIALTPTRQSLAYLPLLIYILAQSFSSWRNRKIVYSAMLVYLSVFLYFFPGFVRERQDKVNEPELTAILKQYNPDLVVCYNTTIHGTLFPMLRQDYNYIDTDHHLYLNKPLNNYQTVVFFSTWEDLTSGNFTKHQELWNKDNPEQDPWLQTYEQYKIIYQKILTSNIEHEPNNWNSNGKNNLFLYVLVLK
jgi:hypothetical protein